MTLSRIGILLATAGLLVGTPAGAQTVNTMLAGVPAAGSDRFVVFAADEFAEGRDLNGDGDMNDLVAYVDDGTTITNLGLDASGGLAASNSYVVVIVKEANQGDADLNGDGDSGDFVVHVYDGSSTVNLMLDGFLSKQSFKNLRESVSDSFVAFAVRESLQGGTDLDGDGDAVDEVLHVYDGSSVRNLGVDVGRRFAVSNTYVAYSVDEAGSGLPSLNGDLDVGDHVVHVYDGATTTNLGLAIDGDGLLGFAVSDRFVVFEVSEARQGNTDLNGDADAADSVLHVYDGATTHNLGLATTGQPYPFLNFDASETFVGFPVDEAGQGADLNGDGDLDDIVAHVFDGVATTNTSFAMVPGLWDAFGVSDTFVAFSVSEARQGAGDLNGDGDVTDRVIHVYNGAVTTNLGLDALDDFAVTNSLVAFTVIESAQGHTDLNGDLDTFDSVAHVYDGAQVTNLRLHASGGANAFAASDSLLSFRVEEAGQAMTDLNGDADTDDYVTYVRDATGLINLGLADASPQQLWGGRLAFAVSEAAQGDTDLNNDGDATDRVIHIFEGRDSNGGAGSIPAEIDITAASMRASVVPGLDIPVVCGVNLGRAENGLAKGSIFYCSFDFDDEEDEADVGCDANGNGIIAGETFRIGSENNGTCRTADIVLSYQPAKRKTGKKKDKKKDKDESCTGLESVTCREVELSTTIVNGSHLQDDTCDGTVNGEPFMECIIKFEIDANELADRRDAECPAPGGCLSDKDAEGFFDAYYWMSSELKRDSDSLPVTDGGLPNETEEVSSRAFVDPTL